MSRARALHITLHQIAAAGMVLFAIAMMFNRLACLALSLSLSRFKDCIRVRNRVRARKQEELLHEPSGMQT
jgi:hypothetical protein